MNKKVRWITETAVMLALLVALQALTKGFGQFVTGSCVNAVLAVTVLTAGLGSGIVVAVLNQLLVRSDRPDQAMLVSLAGLITTMMLLVREISSLFDLIKSLFGF